MRHAFISIFVVLAVLLAGCTYTNSEYYYANPIASDSAIVFVSTNLDTIDPIFVKDSLLFKYRAEIENGMLYLTNASIYSLNIYQFYTDYDPDTIPGPYVLVDSFWIHSDMAVDSGTYPMIFEVYYSSNTNSLGDILGVEADVLELNFDLKLKGGKK